MTVEIVDQATEQDEQAIARRNYIEGLRTFAAFLDAHPNIMPPLYSSLLSRVDTREQLSDAARIGGWTKDYQGEYFALKRSFGGVLFEVYTDRTTVCRKQITGQHVVPATPERVEETFEWVCEDASLLKAAIVTATGTDGQS